MKVNKELNHSAAHLLAAAVLKLYPEAKIAIGPAIDEGFYYDIDFPTPILEQDLQKIEKQMKKIASGGFSIQKIDEPADFSDNPYKTELINEFTADKKEITWYGMVNPSNGKSIFTDLCKGGHINNVAHIKHFKLLNLAGAYWRGDSKKQQLTRIYGTAWEKAEELKAYLALRDERKMRDHRKLGKEMNIFTFHQLAGQGFPIWLSDGAIVKNKIKNYIRELEKKYDFVEVQTPEVGDIELYRTSGHLAHYSDDMFKPIKMDNEELILRPMTCPHHILIYKMARKSYRDLPIRMSEHANLFRYEKSGALTGLERVRSMELTDAHIFARQDQIKAEFLNAFNLIKEALEKFNIEIDHIALSLRDKNDRDKYFDNDELWNNAENILRDVIKEIGIDFTEEIGEAAFYGPKMDIQVRTVLGHEITMSTLQLDFVLPMKFELSYIDENENKVLPIMIHRGLIGTYERFIATLLEQTKGDLPFWVSPRQVTIIPVSINHHLDYAKTIYNQLREKGFDIHLDSRDERVGKKIREAQISKTKYQIVVGDEEVTKNMINIRAYGSEEKNITTLDQFIKDVKHD